MTTSPKRIYEFGPFRLDVERHRLTRNHVLVPLTPKALDFLHALVQNAGRLVEKNELMQKVWPDTFVEESNLSVHVFALRRALGETSEGQSYIETIPRQGYRFTAEVHEPGANGGGVLVERRTLSRVTIEEHEAPAEHPRPSIEGGFPLSLPFRSSGTQSRWINRPVVLIAFALLLAVTSVVAYRLLGRAGNQPPPTPADVKSLAVLPFRSLDAPQDEQYLGLGLADSLITQLGRTQKFTVRPTSAIGKYADGQHDSLAVGRALGVEAVLEGNSQTSGDRIRVTARVLRVSDGVSLWAGKFDERFTDIFAVQDSISQQVAEALISNLGERAKRSPGRRPTENIEAYQLYLKGRYLWGKKDTEGVKKALQYFEQAIKADPKFAQAYSGLADCYVALSEFSAVPRREAYSKAMSSLRKAISLDPGLAETHTTLGFILLSRDWDYEEAEKEFKLAIELDPNYATAYQFYGVHLLAVGQTDAAIAQTRRALELDPLSILNNSQLGRCLYLAHRFNETIDQSLKTLELDSTSASAHAYLGQSYAHQGRLAEATAALQKAVEMSAGRAEMKAALGYAYALASNRNAAREIIDELGARNKESSYVSYHIATIYAGLGEKEQALNSLERAYQERDIFMGVRLSTDPKLDSLRSDRRFQNLLQRVGLTS